MGRLDAKTVVVAGASRGIGKGIAVAAAKEGAKVVIVARREGQGDPRFPGAMETALRDVRAVGGEVLGVHCDIGDIADVKRLVAEVEQKFGGIDVVISNAVVIHYGSMLDDDRRGLGADLCRQYPGPVPSHPRGG